MKSKTGTNEWAPKTINLFNGKCANGCVYCYAHANMVRFGQNLTWRLKENVAEKKYKKRDYLTMYPSTHDIREEDIPEHVYFLTNFLRSGSEILIVTKAHYDTFLYLEFALKEFKPQIEFRFTIGSVSNDIIRVLEPCAPLFEDRLQSLIYAHRKGYKTSVSIEPMLDMNPDHVVHATSAFVTGDIWIGKMRNAAQRCRMNGTYQGIVMLEIDKLVSAQLSYDNMVAIFKELDHHPKVRWKDSMMFDYNKYKKEEYKNML